MNLKLTFYNFKRQLTYFFLFISTLVFAQSDLVVTKTINNTTPLVGNNVIFTITARNNGTSNNNNVTVNDLLPSGYTYVSNTTSTGTYNSTTGVWTIGNLNNGASATLTITATVKSSGIYTNTATINTSSGISDPNLSNNVASVTPLVQVDSDGDGVPDSTDLDDDNDGILDCDENGLNKLINQIFKLNGNASQISSNEVQLTPALNFKAGQMWSYGKIDFTKNFSIPFEAYLGNKNDNGADGIAIVFQNDPYGINATGGTGGGIGARGIQNGVVLELDTYDNKKDGLLEPAADHGQIWKSLDQTAITSTVNLPNLEDGAWHAVVVNWDSASQTLSYTVDGTLAGTYTGNIVTNYFGGANKVYYGFTASTGGLNNDQRVRFSSLCSLPLELDTDGDNIPNSLDLDSDGDGCFDAIEGGDNVTQAMLNASNAIGTNISGTLNIPAIATVDANGVPVITNTGSTFNVDAKAQGQTVGTAYTANPLVAGVISATSPICSGSTSTISVTTAPQGATFQWQRSTASDFSTGITNLGSALTTAPTTFTTSALTSTTYFRLLVTSAGGCTKVSNIVTVTVNAIPVIPNIVTTSPTCTANGTATIENYDSTYNYTFSPTGPTVGSGGVISGYSYSTAYTVTATLNGCTSSASSPFYVYAKLNCTDTDGDGIYDSEDLDDDNDGILDTVECPSNIKFSEDFSSYVNSTTSVAPLSGTNVETGYPYKNPSGNVAASGGYAVALNANSYFGSVLNTGGNASIVFDGNNSNNGEKLVFKAKNIGITQGKAYTFEFKYHIGASLPGPTFYVYVDPDGVAGTASPILINSISTTSTTGSALQKLTSNWTATANSTAAEFYIVNNNYLGGNVGRNWILDDIKVISYDCDTDGDNVPDTLDLDSDGDGCFDAIEGGDNITQTMLNGSNAIGSNISGTLNSPAIATVDANGVPVITNTGSTFNVDGQAQGQTAGSSANASVNGCYCYKPAQTTGTALDTNHGITALGRAGDDNSNWPMVRKGAWTVLEAKTKGFVVNRLTDAQVSAIPSADLREGMMVYNITQDCLQINIDGTATGWKCFNTQTCPDL